MTRDGDGDGDCPGVRVGVGIDRVGGGTTTGGDSSHRRPHRISQSVFDEAVLENQDLFDQSPEEAILETSNQFRTQGLDLSHLCLSHPETDVGKAEREGRSKFDGWSEYLDGRVNVDGTVVVEANDVEEVVVALRGIGDRCSEGRRGRRKTVVVGVPSRSSVSRGSSTAGEGDEGNDDGGDDEDVSADADAVPSTVNSGDDDEPDDGGGGLAYLSLLQRSGGLYTLMSFLGVVVVSDGGGEDDDGGDGSERILREVVRTLIAVLAPPSPSSPTREVRAALRDGFSAFERLVGLIDSYADLLLCAEGKDDRDRNDDVDGGGGEGERRTTPPMRRNARIGLLADLIRLGCASTRGCERNKVAFVRAGQNGDDDGGRRSGRRGQGGVAAVMKSFDVALNKDDAVRPPREAEIRLLTESCRLLAILCRFDDFRSQSGGESEGPANPNVSSAHDHVLEFHRAGAVPTLHRIATLASNDDGGNYDDEGEDERTALASAALSATRALAVNDEIVQSLVAVGALNTARAALAASVVALDINRPGDDDDNADDANGDDADERRRRHVERRRRSLASASLGLLRNLCGNDEIKTALCLGSSSSSSTSATSSAAARTTAATPSVLPSILSAMKLYQSDRTVQEHGCGTLAAMALRKPDNALKIVHEQEGGGGPNAILTAMRCHPNDVAVQRQGALAIRNVVCRLAVVGDGDGGGGPSGTTTATSGVREAFLDLGAESVLRDVAGRHRGSVDESYAALRDLGVDVAWIRFDSDNIDANGSAADKNVRATRGPTMFGEAKTNFRPVYEESEGLNGGIGGGRSAVEEAVARRAAASLSSSDVR